MDLTQIGTLVTAILGSLGVGALLTKLLERRVPSKDKEMDMAVREQDLAAAERKELFEAQRTLRKEFTEELKSVKDENRALRTEMSALYVRISQLNTEVLEYKKIAHESSNQLAIKILEAAELQMKIATLQEEFAKYVAASKTSTRTVTTVTTTPVKPASTTPAEDTNDRPSV